MRPYGRFSEDGLAPLQSLRFGQPSKQQKRQPLAAPPPGLDATGPRPTPLPCRPAWGSCPARPGCDTFTYMASLTLRIPDGLEQQLEAESRARGISKSDVVREALERDLRVQAWRKLRDQFRPHLERAGVFTEADVFARLGEDV